MRNDKRIESALGQLLGPGDGTRVRKLTDKAGISVPRLSQLFALRTGTTPGELLRLFRAYRSEVVIAEKIIQKHRNMVIKTAQAKKPSR